MTSERDVHPDDGTIHAWLDRQLDDTSAATLEAHLQRCDECAERVAEARGLIAGTSRILSSLDADPTHASERPVLMVSKPPVEPPRAVALAGSIGTPRWFRLTPARSAIAAVLVVAVATAIVRENQEPRERLASTPGVALGAGSRAAEGPAATPPAAPVVAEYDSTAGARVAAARTFAKAQRETTVNADLARVSPAKVPATVPATSSPTGQAIAAAKVADSVVDAPARANALRGAVPGVSVAAGAGAATGVAGGIARSAPRPMAMSAGVEAPQCYRVESATGDAAAWGPVPLPFVLALDAPATGSSARVLTTEGQDADAHAVFERRAGDSLVFTLRRIGYAGTLAVGTPGDVRAGVMRSAPTGVQLETVVAAAPRAAEQKRALRKPSAVAERGDSAAAADRTAAPAVPVVMRKVECGR